MTTTMPVSEVYPERSRATVVLVLGILAVAATGIFGPLAWWLGHRELTGIAEGRRPPENKTTARIGQALGILGTAMIVTVATLFTLALTGVIDVR